MSLFHLRSCHFSFPFPFSVNGRLAVFCERERERAPCDIYFVAIPRFISFLFSFRALFFSFPTISNRNIYWPLSNISLTDVFSYFPLFLSPIISHSISAYLYPFLVLSFLLYSPMILSKPSHQHSTQRAYSLSVFLHHISIISRFVCEETSIFISKLSRYHFRWLILWYFISNGYSIHFYTIVRCFP